METGSMSRAKRSFGVLGITVAMLSTAAAQPADLPTGPNREVVSRACQACHDLSMVVAATGLTREGWNATIEEMIGYGMRVTSDDRARILDYLSSYLGSPSAPAPADR
jgi:cytochrome c5